MKNVKMYAAALLVMAAAIGMVGCNYTVHQHTFSEGWVSDAQSHWHEATCEHIENIRGLAPHYWNQEDYQYDSKFGKDIRACLVCGYVVGIDHVHGDDATWTKTATTHKETYDCCGAAKIAEVAHDWKEGIIGVNLCTVCGYMEANLKEFVEVAGGTVKGAAYPDEFCGVFTEGRIVKISTFYMGKYEVTQAQYKAVMAGQKVTVDGTEYALADSPSYCTELSYAYQIEWGQDRSNNPVENVTWYDAVYFCNALSEHEKLDPCYAITVTAVSDGHITDAAVEYDSTKNGYRLPTEAEWEYAARGGDPEQDDWNYTFSGADTAKDSTYESKINSGLDSVGWYKYNNITGKTGDFDVTDSVEGSGTHKVGQKEANRLCIHDMSGNVYEWCWDWVGGITSGTVTDPVGVKGGTSRIQRGGDWDGNAFIESVYHRSGDAPDCHNDGCGFRLVRSSSK